jgi:NitT/TauT family transport system substrate-binding protein
MWRALRRAGALLAFLLAAGIAHAAELGTMKVGVLKFGTVNWELDVIKAHGLDTKEGFTLEVQPFGGNDAADVALMGGAVDAIVEDWLFVSRQRADGLGLTFIPYSSNVGAVMVKPDSGIESLADLRGKRIGVAGGPLDKGWLMLQAYARKTGGMDLAKEVEPVYGAPPLLTEKLKSGELAAVLN